ncbi:MAG: multidrug effflux MFS transporter [Pseudomonadota bacterium]
MKCSPGSPEFDMFVPAATPPRLFTLVFLTGLSVLTLNMFLPSLANMADDFDADYGLVSLSVAGYLLMTGVIQLIVGPLSDRFGRRPVLLGGMVIFLFASIGCALSENIWWFLGFRTLQSAVISGAALSRAVVRDMVSEKEAASLLGYIGTAMAIAPMVGPLFGGILDEAFGWRSSFWVFAGIGAFALWLTFVDLGETNKQPSHTFGEQFAAYPELFRSRRFWGYSFCMAFSVGGFYAFLAGAPLVAAAQFNMSTGVLGAVIGSITVGFFFGNLIAGRFARHVALSTMMIIGRLTACIGLGVGLIFVLSGTITIWTVFGATIFVGMGNGLTIPSASAGAMSVRPQLAGSASGLSGALMVAGGALLTWLVGSVLTQSNAAPAMMSIMWLTSFCGLLAALYVRWVDGRESVVAT